MSFLNKRILLLATALFLFSEPLFAGGNPFSIELGIGRKNIEGELTDILKINISSRSIEESMYQFIIYIPRNHLEILEGKRVFRGKLGPLKTKNFYISLKGIADGEGEIRIKVYAYDANENIDPSSLRVFYSGYVVEREDGEDFKITILKTEEREQIQETEDMEAIALEEEGEELGISVEGEEEDIQRFIIDPRQRANSFLRFFLLLCSFLILGYLFYRKAKD